MRRPPHRPKPKDTIKKLEQVAERRYQSGLKLIDLGDDYAGVEQLAFTAEMLLKSAYFRNVKKAVGLARTTSEITRRHLRDAEQEAQRLSIPHHPEGFHSLLFWAALLVAKRRTGSRPLATGLEREFLLRVREMHVLWLVDNRYQPIEYQFADVLAMRANVTWLRDHHVKLWR
ncbi:MAG: hypothetical protein JO250_22105 [Armatimonadetes bacterium]|nr:hypothetical protein [Armatimonadota bacterium]